MRVLCLPTIVAHAYSRSLLPKRVARSVFWRSLPYTRCHEHGVVRKKLRIGEVLLDLQLPLKFRQNWTLLFDDCYSFEDATSLRRFGELARGARCVLDVGMNAGMYLYHAVCLRGSGASVFGFEPNAEMVESVRDNLRRNQVVGVEIVPACVSSRDGQAELYLTDSDHMHSLERQFLTEKGRPILAAQQVPVVALDSFLSARGLRPDLVKIDVEGHEDQAVWGARQSIERDHPALLIEITERNRDRDFIAFLFDCGYRVRYVVGGVLLPISSPRELSAKRVPGAENYFFSVDQPPC